MAIDKHFADRFARASVGLDRALFMQDEPLLAYYLGLMGGMLATVLPEEEADVLLSVSVPGAAAINRVIGGVLGRAKGVLAGESDG